MKEKILLIIISFILLPTGTPEDAFTTIPLIKLFGWEVYVLLIITILGVLWYYKITYKNLGKEFRRATKKWR